LIGSEPHSHKPFAPKSVSVANRLAFKQNFMGTLCSFPHDV
jgi:hypothetical protein